jgi:hypothetical protein
MNLATDGHATPRLCDQYKGDTGDRASISAEEGVHI